MKLLYCIPSLNNTGGTERVLSEKVNYLACLPNHKIYIVTTDQRENQSIRFPLHKDIKVIHLNQDFTSHFKEHLPKKYFSHKKKIREYKKKLELLISELNIDICISTCGKEIDFLGKMNANCKVVAEIHYSMNNRKQFISTRHNGILWKLLGIIRTYQLLQSVKLLDKFVVLTKEDKKQWDKHCTNVVQIYNPSPFNSSTLSKLVNKRIITVGRLDQQKGYDMLIEAWNLVVQKHPDWILEIYGEGDLRNQLEKKITEFNIAKSARLCGISTEIESKYLESTLFVASSRYEGFHMGILEAMSCGLPAISFDCEFGPRELIDDGITGFLVEPNNVNLLADKICYLIDNENLRKTMGINAIEKSNLFSIDKIMLNWINLFDSLISEK